MSNELGTGAAVEKIVKLAQHAITPEVLTITDPRTSKPVEVVAMGTTHGVVLQSLKPLFVHWWDRPERMRGEARFHAFADFLAHVDRFKDEGSGIFYVASHSRQGAAFEMTAIYDYHEQTNEPGDDHAFNPIMTADESDGARFCGHRAVFTASGSRQSQVWFGREGRMMGQADFAEFIEENLEDVCEPPESDMLKDIFPAWQTFGGAFATGAKLLEVSRRLHIHAHEEVKQAINLATGEIEIGFVATHSEKGGGSVQVPALFAIAIPLWEGGDPMSIVARLRYRKQDDGKVLWAFKLHRVDMIFERAIAKMVEQARKDTGLPVWSGTPEFLAHGGPEPEA